MMARAIACETCVRVEPMENAGTSLLALMHAYVNTWSDARMSMVFSAHEHDQQALLSHHFLLQLLMRHSQLSPSLHALAVRMQDFACATHKHLQAHWTHDPFFRVPATPQMSDADPDAALAQMMQCLHAHDDVAHRSSGQATPKLAFRQRVKKKTVDAIRHVIYVLVVEWVCASCTVSDAVQRIIHRCVEVFQAHLAEADSWWTQRDMVLPVRWLMYLATHVVFVQNTYAFVHVDAAHVIGLATIDAFLKRGIGIARRNVSTRNTPDTELIAECLSVWYMSPQNAEWCRLILHRDVLQARVCCPALPEPTRKAKWSMWQCHQLIHFVFTLLQAYLSYQHAANKHAQPNLLRHPPL
jgi:hypothetical protein